MAGQPASVVRPMGEGSHSDEVEARAALVLGLRQLGISSVGVLSAIERLPRRLFLTARLQRLAYEDSLLPIECGQTISPPSLVAMTLQALNVEPGHKVLEIGTGSGYQAAALSFLASRVETVDRYATLTELANSRFATLRLQNVKAHHADGLKGLKAKGPYDRIVATAAVEVIPDSWIDQLKPGGRLVAAVGKAKTPQILIRYQKTDNMVTAEDLMPLRTVMLVPGEAKKL